VTVPVSVACADAEVCAADEGGLCAESTVAASTMRHNRAAGKNFILFECGRDLGARLIAGIDHRWSGLVILRRGRSVIQIEKSTDCCP
jgi:hypothetical protein